MNFRTYHLYTEANESQFAAEFNALVAFLRKWDQLGLEKYAKVVGTGYFRVLYDFLSSLNKGDSANVRRQAANVLKLLPSTLLFGTAIPVAGLMDLGHAGFLMLGLKLIQYAYWPFWAWASKNLKNADPHIARRAEMVISAIPDQWRAILATESITYDRTISPQPGAGWDFLMRGSDGKNPEYVAKWQRSLTHHVFRFPLAQDRFVHFTTNARASQIAEEKVIKGVSVFAVSSQWGTWYPGVQYTHILKNTRTRQNQTRPNYGQEISAVIFTTSAMPSSATQEEVIWNGPIPIENVSVVSSRDAIRMLKHTKYGGSVGSEDLVEYY